MKIFIATDHRGVEIEKELVSYLKANNEVIESTLPHSDVDDYVDFAIDVCKNVRKDSNSMGVLICGSGIGMSIAANKVRGIRASRCISKEDAFITRNDNNANVLCIGYNENIDNLKEIIDTFINTPFSNEERHVRRVNKIIKFENGEYNGL